MPSQKLDTQRWKARKGATDARLARLLATLEQRAEAAWASYFDRIKVVLDRESCVRLMCAWQAEQDTPADLAAIIEADPEARRLERAAGGPLWLLDMTTRGGIPSEHFVYAQTGKLRGPNGEH